jgi:hypothetical protein
MVTHLVETLVVLAVAVELTLAMAIMAVALVLLVREILAVTGSRQLGITLAVAVVLVHQASLVFMIPSAAMVVQDLLATHLGGWQLALGTT